MSQDDFDNKPNFNLISDDHNQSFGNAETGSEGSSYGGSGYMGNRPDPEARIRQIAADAARAEVAKNKPKGGFWKGLLSAVCGAALALVILFGLGKSGKIPALKPEQEPGTVTPDNKINISLNQDSTVENAVAAKAIPSIVGITSVTEGTYTNPFLYGIPRYTEAVGSGVIFSEDGLIVTNSHVVEGGDVENVKVLLSDQSERPAKILWADPTLDLAVIKIQAKGLRPIEFADREAKVGDKAIAIGNPLGLDLQSTLTSGYISGLDRSITVEGGNIMNGLIQTDAAINGGNSGGALLNAQGKLVGINTAKAGEADGIGFAIPVSTVRPIVDKIKETGSFEPTYIGISGFNVEMARSLGVTQELPVDKGVIIHEVLRGSPASRAGLKTGDIIVAIDDKPVESMNAIKTLLLNYRPGDEAEISYYHGTKKKSTKIVFDKYNQDDHA